MRNKIFKLIAFTISLLSYQFCVSQQCGTQLGSPSEVNKYLLRHQKFMNKMAMGKSIPTTTRYIPVYWHIVRETNGSGGISLSDARAALARCNGAFSGVDIHFYECGYQYINSDTYYDFDICTEESGLVASRLITGVANVFVVDDLVGSCSSGCGYANFPGTTPAGGNYSNNFLLMDRDCMDDVDQTTLQHEFGHFFDLRHTHETCTNNSCAELVTRGTGKNCDTAGDLFCDTPADPTLICGASINGGNVSCNIFTNDCNYCGTSTDANGDAYNPSASNIMSYSCKECRTDWSPMQIAKMEMTVSASGAIDRKSLGCSNCTASTGSAPDGLLGTYILRTYFNHDEIESNIDITNSSVLGSELYLIASSRVRLLPGFSFYATNSNLNRFGAIADECGDIDSTGPFKEVFILEDVTSETESTFSVYPNPFQNQTNIELQINEIEELVTVEVFDLVGKKVAVLADNQRMNHGAHKLVFESGQHAGNIFLCRIQIGEKSFIEKIVKMD